MKTGVFILSLGEGEDCIKILFKIFARMASDLNKQLQTKNCQKYFVVTCLACTAENKKEADSEFCKDMNKTLE